MNFSLFRKISHSAAPDPTAEDVGDMIADNERMLADARAKLAEVEARLSRPGDYETDEQHSADESERDYRRREILAFEDRLRRLPAERDVAAERERVEARDARLAEAPALVKEARRALGAVEKIERQHADALEALREIEEKHNALLRLAKEAGRPLPGLYSDRDEPEVRSPDQEISEMRWGKEDRGGVWAPCGGTFVNGRPTDLTMTQRLVKRTILGGIIKAAKYFQTPTATTVIAGLWPRR